jgi:hypothetical protein
MLVIPGEKIKKKNYYPADLNFLKCFLEIGYL